MRKWAFTAEGDLTESGLAIGGDGIIYLAAGTNGLYALGPAAPSPVPDQAARTTIYSSAATANVALNFPSGVAADDICVAEFSDAATSLTVKTVPAGWTPIRSDNTGASGAAEYLYWYQSLGVGNDPAEFTWTLSSSTNTVYAGWVQCFSGVNLDNPIDPSNSTGNGTNSTRLSVLNITVNMVVKIYGIANFSIGFAKDNRRKYVFIKE